MKKTRILLADDHSVVRAGIRLVLENEWGWQVCGEASTGREAVELAGKLQPDIVVLDIGMPELNGLDAARQIKRAVPQAEVLIFTSHEDEQLVRDVFAAGARGYLLKSDAAQYLTTAVKALLEHKPYYSAAVSETIFAEYLKGGAGGPGAEGQTGRLTPRERELVQLLGEGKMNKEVASILGLSVKTIETHRKNVMRKLGLKSFSELVVYAIRNHLIQG